MDLKQNRIHSEIIFLSKTALLWDMTPCRLPHNHRHSEDYVATICKVCAFLLWGFVLTDRSWCGGGNWNWYEDLNLLLGGTLQREMYVCEVCQGVPTLLRIKVCWRPNTASVPENVTKWSEVDCLSKRQKKEVWRLFVCLIVYLAAI
jgi:hypothetical protein